MEDISSDEDFSILSDCGTPDRAQSPPACGSSPLEIEQHSNPKPQESDGSPSRSPTRDKTSRNVDKSRSKRCRKSHRKLFPPPVEHMLWKLIPIELDDRRSNVSIIELPSTSSSETADSSSQQQPSSSNEQSQVSVVDVTQSESETEVLEQLADELLEQVIDDDGHLSESFEVIDEVEDSDIEILEQSNCEPDGENAEMKTLKSNRTPSSSCENSKDSMSKTVPDIEVLKVPDYSKGDVNVINEPADTAKRSSPPQQTSDEMDNSQVKKDIPQPIPGLKDILSFVETLDVQEIARILATKRPNATSTSNGSSVVDAKEVKTEIKYYRPEIPFHEMLLGLPMGKPVTQPQQPPPVVTIEDDDVIRDKAAPLAMMQCHNRYIPLTCSEPYPQLVEQRTQEKTEPQDLQLQGRKYSSDFAWPKQQQPPVISTGPEGDLRKAAHLQYFNKNDVKRGPSRVVSMRPPPEAFAPKPIVNVYNDGPAVSCKVCTFKADYYYQVVEHYVNKHPNSDPPCGINSETLELVKGEVLERPNTVRTRTGVKWMDDLNWIPDQGSFTAGDEKVYCKQPNCNFTHISRERFIEHVKGHRDALLKVPVKPVHSIYKCRMCQDVYVKPEEFYEHCTGHTGEYMYGCGHCSVRMSTRQRLRSHHNISHNGRKYSEKANDSAIPRGLGDVIYGHVCTLCGFVQINRSRVENHIKCHPAHLNPNIHPFDLATPEPKLVQAAPPPPPTNSDRQKTVESRKNAASVEKSPTRRKSAPVKIRGDPRTAVSRQEKFTQFIPGEPTAVAANANMTVEPVQPTANESGETDVNSPTATEVNGPADDAIATSNEVVEQRSGGTVIEQSLAVETDHRANLQKDSAVAVDSLPDESEECTIDFEAVTVKAEGQVTDNNLSISEDLPANDISFSEAPEPLNNNAAAPLQAPTICDTITRLSANLGHTTSSLVSRVDSSSEIPSPAVTTVSTPLTGEAAPTVSSRKQVNWNERRKIIICSCSHVTHSPEAFYSHRLAVHKGEKRTACNECQQKFDKANEYVSHLWSTCPKLTARIYACKAEALCRFTTSNRTIFEDHVVCEHPAADWLPCYWCKSRYNTAVSLAQHISSCSKSAAIHVLNNPGTTVEEPPSAPSPEEELPPPHLKVVYLCSVKDCRHQSLERQVFIDHMQVDHPEKKVHTCRYCSLSVGNLYSLVIHTEAKHQEGVAAVAQVPTNEVSSVSSSATVSNHVVLQSSRGENSKTPVLVSILKGPVVVQGVETGRRLVYPINPKLLDDNEWLAEEDRRMYKLESKMDTMCQIVSLCFRVTRNLPYCEVMEAKLHQWRTNRVNYNPPEVRDPVEFVHSIKKPGALKAIYSERKLRHLYKCGGPDCVFSSNVENELREHLTQKNCMVDLTLHCVYCGEEHITIRGLVTHVTKKHGLSIYQCPHCIYRAKQVLYVLLHIAKRHPEQGELVEVFRCPLPESEEKPDEEDDVAELLSIIHPVSCIDACPFVSLDSATFLQHHMEAHSQLTHVICYLCSAKVTRENLESHLKLHNVFDYHCEYCGFGDNLLTEVILHACLMHPHRTGRVLIRTRKVPAKVPVPSLPPNNMMTTASTMLVPNSSVHQLPSTTSADVVPPAVAAATGGDLLKCGFQMCSYSTSVIAELASHVINCPHNQPTNRLQCHQCIASWMTPMLYIEHVSSHTKSQIKFFCGVCDFSAPLTSSIKLHLEAIHNLEFHLTNAKVRPSERGSNVTEYVFNPSPVKMKITKSANGRMQSSIAISAPTLLANKDTTNWKNKRVSVSDLDSLPNKEIFDESIKCADCDMAFKVRKNLVKHLEQHVRARESPTKRAGTSPCRSSGMSRRNSADPTYQLWHPEHFPQYVPIENRYSCSFNGCSHNSSNSMNLETHISVVHGNLTELPCPHCPEVFEDMPTFHRHIELHGPKLYMCLYCTYINNYQNIVDGHCRAAHLGLPPGFKVERNEIEEDAVDGNSNETNVVEARGELRCSCCPNFRCHTEAALKNHLIQTFSLETYRCNVCSKVFSKEGDVQDHFLVDHYEITPDFTIFMTQQTEEFLNQLVESEATKRRGLVQSASTALPPQPPRLRTPPAPPKPKTPPVVDQRESTSRPPPPKARTPPAAVVDHNEPPRASSSVSQPPPPPVTPLPQVNDQRKIQRKQSNAGPASGTQQKKARVVEKLNLQANKAATSRQPKKSQKSTVSTKMNHDSNHVSNGTDKQLPEFRYYCPCCPYSVKQEERMRSHLRTNHVKSKLEYKCNLCGDIFVEKQQALQHQDLAHSLQSVDEITELRDENNTIFINWVITLLKKIKVAENDPVHRPIQLACQKDNCPLTFTILYQFRSHFIAHHLTPAESGNPSLPVAVVADKVQSKTGDSNKSAKGKSLPAAASSSATNLHVAMCPYCNYKNTRKDVRTHVFRHYDFNFFKCPYCDHEGRFRLQVRTHVVNEHPFSSVQVFQKEKPANLVVRPVVNTTKVRSFLLVDSPEPTSDSEGDKSAEEAGHYSCDECQFQTSSVTNIRYHCQNAHHLATMIVLGPVTKQPFQAKYPAVAEVPMEYTAVEDADSGRTEEIVTCQECGEKLKGLTMWMIHYNLKHGERSQSRSANKWRKGGKKSRKRKNSDDDDSVEQPANKTSKTDDESRDRNTEVHSTYLRCSHCGFTSVNLVGIRNHWKKTHLKKPLAYKPVRNVKTYKCSSCAFKTPNLKEGKVHLKDHHFPRFMCKRCSKSFTTLMAIRVHHTRLHGQEAALAFTENQIDSQIYQRLLSDMLKSYGNDGTEARSTVDRVETPTAPVQLSEDETETPAAESEPVREKTKTSTVKPTTDTVTEAEPATVIKKEKRARPVPSEMVKQTRRRTGPLWGEEEFSYYKRKPDPVDWTKLTVNTNFKGFKNANIQGTRFREIFSLEPIIVLKDLYK